MKFRKNYGMIDSILIADSSPLIALSTIEQLPLLPKLYQEVIIPQTVWEEITIQGRGMQGADTVKNANWLVRKQGDAKLIKVFNLYIDKGEAEALALGMELDNCIILLDDLRARKVAA